MQKRLKAIKYLYGIKKLDKNSTLDIKNETLTSWALDGYENIAQVEADYSDTDIEILYNNTIS